MFSDVPRFSRIGGHLALDFANTVGNHRAHTPRDYFVTFEDLLQWAWEAGLIDRPTADAMRGRADHDPAATTGLLRRAITLREVIYGAFSASAEGRPVPAEHVAFLDSVLQSFPATLRLRAEADGCVCVRQAGPTDEEALLGPVAWAAAELLAADRLAKIRECADAHCGWLFLDLTKNRSRRWCAMGDCGSRAKARRYYRRKTGGT